MVKFSIYLNRHAFIMDQSLHCLQKGNWQTVQPLIRSCRMGCLIRVFTVCIQFSHFSLGISNWQNLIYSPKNIVKWVIQSKICLKDIDAVERLL